MHVIEILHLELGLGHGFGECVQAVVKWFLCLAQHGVRGRAKLELDRVLNRDGGRSQDECHGVGGIVDAELEGHG